MNAPYQNVGEANEHYAFLTGGDGHDKATLMRRTLHTHDPAGLPVLNDDEWQAMIWLINAAPELLRVLRQAVNYLELENPSDEHDRACLESMLHYARVAIDRATGHPGEQHPLPQQ